MTLKYSKQQMFLRKHLLESLSILNFQRIYHTLKDLFLWTM